jgi:hypothetical protein
MSAVSPRNGTAATPNAAAGPAPRRSLAVLLALPLIAASTGAFAQPAPVARPATPAAAPAVSPAFEPTRVIWEALPLDRRVAIQEALVWSGDYAGSLDGTFGKMTFDALSAFLARRKLTPDAVGGEVAAKAFAEVTATKKAAVGWQMVADPATGVRIGVATRVVGPIARAEGGSRWPSPDGRVELRTHRIAGTDLARVFDLVRADAPGRRITYSVLRADWFVVADDLGGKRGYARFVRGPTDIRGFTFVLDAALGPELDRVVIATAGTFDPFPGTAPSAPAAGPTPAAPATPSTPQANLPAKPATPATGLATALVVGPGRALTAAAAIADCKSLTVAGRPAKPEAAASSGGLVLLGYDGQAAAPSFTLTAAAPGAPVVALAATDGGRPVVVSGTLAAGGARLALQRGGGGAVVADLSGRVIGIVTGKPDETRLVAGLVPEAVHPLAAPADLAAATDAKLDTSPGTAGSAAKVVATLAPAVLPVVCGR